MILLAKNSFRFLSPERQNPPKKCKLVMLRNGFFGNLWKWYAPERKFRDENGGLSCAAHYPIYTYGSTPPPPPGGGGLEPAHSPLQRPAFSRSSRSGAPIFSLGRDTYRTKMWAECPPPPPPPMDAQINLRGWGLWQPTNPGLYAYAREKKMYIQTC